MQRKALFLCICLSSLFVHTTWAQKDSVSPKHDGVYCQNPLIYADIPDPDVICVGKDYYMVSTTNHMSPGAPIMHSRDMKHWSIISYVFDALHDSPANDLDGGNIYSRGQWAASIRYHKGRFYVFFGTGVHSYIFTAKNPKGPWTLTSRFEKYWHDASMLFDGKHIYLVHCRDAVLYVKEFTRDLQGFLDGDALGTKIIALNDGCLHEGVHAYKINGRYYLTTIWWPYGGDRTELCWRADNITGPYEKRVILSDDLGFPHHGVAQGGIWQAHNGLWYSMQFQDHEGVGRIPCLLPCVWKDGWPMLGTDGDSRCPAEFIIPDIHEQGETKIVSSDDFSEEKLKLVWQWNHNPDNSLWSLSERPGWLRMKTGKVVQGLFQARNTLTQRTIGPQCTGTIRMDISHMLPGDHAGLCAFCSEPGELTIIRQDDGYSLIMTDRGSTLAEQVLQAEEVWLRMQCDFTTDTAIFSYSTDGKKFNSFGKPFHMIFSMAHFTGNKFAIFNYATRQVGGFVDIDYFDFIQ